MRRLRKSTLSSGCEVCGCRKQLTGLVRFKTDYTVFGVGVYSCNYCYGYTTARSSAMSVAMATIANQLKHREPISSVDGQRGWIISADDLMNTWIISVNNLCG